MDHSVHPARDAERSLFSFDLERTAFVKSSEAPVGVFDSGVGGLTILSALLQELPHERYIYFGDTAHCPYGMRSEAEIIELSIAASRFLLAQGCKLIIVACNTASQAALTALRATFPVPFIGVVPAVKPATQATRRGRVGVLATNQATRANYLRQLIDEFAEGIEVFAAGCPELVTLVEEGELEGPRAEETVRQALQPLLAQGVDVLVLGCTHFPALRPLIARVAGPSVQILDSGTAIARRAHSVLESEGLLRPTPPRGEKDGALQVWCSGNPVHFSEVARKVLGYSITAQRSEQ